MERWLMPRVRAAAAWVAGVATASAAALTAEFAAAAANAVGVAPGTAAAFAAALA